jgi:hypothetical protein
VISGNYNNKQITLLSQRKFALTISGNYNNKQLTLLSQRKFALTSRKTPLCRWFRFAQLAKGKKFRP